MKNANDLTDEELFKLLDERATELKKVTKPLGDYHTKKFASIDAANRGSNIEEDWDSVKKISNNNQIEQDKKEIKRLNETTWEKSIKVKKKGDGWID